MNNKIAVETLTLKEVSGFFHESLNLAFPKANIDIVKELQRLKNEKINNHKWILAYEEFKGAKINFYCQKYSHMDSPIVSIGMTHRTT